MVVSMNVIQEVIRPLKERLRARGSGRVQLKVIGLGEVRIVLVYCLVQATYGIIRFQA